MRGEYIRNCFFAALCVIILTIPSSLFGATFDVTKTADTNDGTCDADCSLREAIIAANESSGADAINIPAGTYTLTIAGIGEDASATGDLDITGDVTISGDGAATTIIDGGGIDRVFQIIDSTTVTVTNVTIQNGNLPLSALGGGGGILNSGSATLDNVIVRNNTVIGVENASDIGGGISNGGGSGAETMTIRNSIITGNSAERGGGLFIGGSVTIKNSTISGNSARAGSALVSFSNPFAMENVTISGNTNSTSGGITIISGGDAMFSNCTIAENRDIAFDFPTGISVGTGASATLRSTIVAKHGRNCGGTVTSLGHNLSDDDRCGFTSSGDLENTDPLLGPLQDNGGPTLTHALLSGSPAIDAGDDAGAPATDQRGISRPQDGDGDGTATVDIGAYEAEPPSTPPGTIPGGGGGGGCSIAGGWGAHWLLLASACWMVTRFRPLWRVRK